MPITLIRQPNNQCLLFDIELEEDDTLYCFAFAYLVEMKFDAKFLGMDRYIGNEENTTSARLSLKFKNRDVYGDAHAHCMSHLTSGDEGEVRSNYIGALTRPDPGLRTSQSRIDEVMEMKAK